MRLTPGALYLRIRQKYGDGLRAAYYRDVVRHRILAMPAIAPADDDGCEIHVLTSSRDWLNLLWVLKSFYRYSGRAYRLCIHDDGSLDDSTLDILAEHCTHARIVARSDADSRLAPLLKPYPRAQSFRNTNPLALKVFDFAAFLTGERMLLLDSDVLFFSRPQALIDRIEDPRYELNTLNRDWRYGYSISMDTAREGLSFDFVENINSGLGLIHRRTMDFDRLESFLALPGIMSHHHRIEQTLIGLCCCAAGFEFLPTEYDVHTGPWVEQHSCRHYTGPIRHRLYSEGIRQLVRQGIGRENLRPPVAS